MEGKLLGNRYELLEKIGDGGMAEVYRAKCHLLQRQVAVKILKPTFVHDKEFLDKFEKEAKSAAMLSHPNIVNIYDVGKEEDFHYIVMELIKGKTLKEVIAHQAGFMSNEDIIRYSMQIAQALEHAHSHHIVHRDIKPQNILIDEKGIAKVADFGIAEVNNNATIVKSKELIGSVHYSSPEQAKGSIINEQTDIYSLGVVMFEMATGRVPFDDDNPVAVAMMHVNEEAIIPSAVNDKLSRGLESVIIRAMQKDPSKRYLQIKDVIADLSKLVVNPNLDIPFYVISKDSPTISIPALEEEQYMAKQQNPKQDKKKKKSIGFSIPKMITIVLLAFVIALVSLSYYGFTVFNENFKAKEVKVPNIERMYVEEAKKILNENGFYVEIINVKESETLERGYVIEQSHKPGTFLKEGYTIKVSISTGKSLVGVPNLKHMEVPQAEVALENAGLTLGNIVYEKNDLPKNYVISQTPSPSDEVPKGTMINLIVSQGTESKSFLMPTLVGKTLTEARNALSPLGVTIVDIQYEENKTYDNNVVISQSIRQGAPITQGATVSIVVSTGTERLVPALEGLTMTAAQELLSGVNLSLGNVTYQETDGPVDVVLAQSMAPGTEFEVGATIDLVISTEKMPEGDQFVTKKIFIPTDFEAAEAVITVRVVDQGVPTTIYSAKHLKTEGVVVITEELKVGVTVNVYHDDVLRLSEEVE